MLAHVWFSDWNRDGTNYSQRVPSSSSGTVCPPTRNRSWPLANGTDVDTPGKSPVVRPSAAHGCRPDVTLSSDTCFVRALPWMQVKADFLFWTTENHVTIQLRARQVTWCWKTENTAERWNTRCSCWGTWPVSNQCHSKWETSCPGWTQRTEEKLPQNLVTPETIFQFYVFFKSSDSFLTWNKINFSQKWTNHFFRH